MASPDNPLSVGYCHDGAVLQKQLSTEWLRPVSIRSFLSYVHGLARVSLPLNLDGLGLALVFDFDSGLFIILRVFEFYSCSTSITILLVFAVLVNEW